MWHIGHRHFLSPIALPKIPSRPCLTAPSANQKPQLPPADTSPHITAFVNTLAQLSSSFKPPQQARQKRQAQQDPAQLPQLHEQPVSCLGLPSAGPSLRVPTRIKLPSPRDFCLLKRARAAQRVLCQLGRPCGSQYRWVGQAGAKRTALAPALGACEMGSGTALVPVTSPNPAPYAGVNRQPVALHAASSKWFQDAHLHLPKPRQTGCQAVPPAPHEPFGV